MNKYTNITDPSFKYVNSDETTPEHLRRVFKRERERLARERKIRAKESKHAQPVDSLQHQQR